MFLRAAALSALHIGVSSLAHILEEIILQHAVRFFEDELNYKPKAISKFENAVKYKANLIINHLYPTVQVTSNHKNILYIGNLDQLLKREITTPIYDIECCDLK